MVCSASLNGAVLQRHPKYWVTHYNFAACIQFKMHLQIVAKSFSWSGWSFSNDAWSNYPLLQSVSFWGQLEVTTSRLRLPVQLHSSKVNINFQSLGGTQLCQKISQSLLMHQWHLLKFEHFFQRTFPFISFPARDKNWPVQTLWLCLQIDWTPSGTSQWQTKACAQPADPIFGWCRRTGDQEKINSRPHTDPENVRKLAIGTKFNSWRQFIWQVRWPALSAS